MFRIDPQKLELIIIYIWYLLFDRAAEHGNVEALVKLGVAYLYNEGSKYIDGHVSFLWDAEIVCYLNILNVQCCN